LGSSYSDSFCVRLPVFSVSRRGGLRLVLPFTNMSGGTCKYTLTIKLVWVQGTSELREWKITWCWVSYGIYTFWMSSNCHGSARGSKRRPNHALIMIYHWPGLIIVNCGFTSCVWIKEIIRPSQPFRQPGSTFASQTRVERCECSMESVKEKLLYLWLDGHPRSYAPQALVEELYVGS